MFFWYFSCAKKSTEKELRKKNYGKRITEKEVAEKEE